MGNCFGKGSVLLKEDAPLRLNPISSGSGITKSENLSMQNLDELATSASTAHYAASPSNLLAISASTAHYAASPFQNTYSTLHKTGEGTLLVALFEGVGEFGHIFAGRANGLLLETFTDASQRCEDTQHVFRTTLQSLHQRCLEISQNTSFSSSLSGASATLVLFSFSSGGKPLSCTSANVGHSSCLLAGVSGSFNSKRPTTTWLSSLHTTNSVKERIHFDRLKNSLREAPLPPTVNTTTTTTMDKQKDVQVRVTRALGMRSDGHCRGQKGASSTQEKDLEVDVTEHALLPTHGHIVVASSGFWAVASPAATALRAHLFSKFQEGLDAALRAGPSTSSIPSPATNQPQIAEHLVNFALGNALDRFSRKPTTTPTENSAELTLQNLKCLPFSHTNEEEHSLSGKLVRKEDHGDISTAVITLHWPHQGPQTHPNPTSRIFLYLKKNAAAADEDDELSSLARFRWAQLRLLADYHRLHRRESLQRWHETVEGIVSKAKIRARVVEEKIKEEHGIAVMVTPLMKVKAKDGEDLSRDDVFQVKATINF